MRDKVGLPFYRSEPKPLIIVDANQWSRQLDPDSPEYPQFHAFGALAHEIGHHRYNTSTVPFIGNTPQQYEQYRSELEGQAIFGAFRIFKELQDVPPFDKQLPFNSIGYLQGMELGQLYKDWTAGRLDDAQAVAAISSKVADTPLRRSDPSPGHGALRDRDGDGQLTHRDLYLRDFERIPRFHPQPDAAPAQPGASLQPAPAPLLSDPAHPGHTLYAQGLQGFAASLSGNRFPAAQQPLIAANPVAGMVSLPASRMHDGLTQEKLDRIDGVTLSSDGAIVMAIEGKPGALPHFRYSLPLEQAHAGSIEAASQQAFDGLQQQQVLQAARQAERDRAPQPEPEGPTR